jgi:hypothetical protein
MHAVQSSFRAPVAHDGFVLAHPLQAAAVHSQTVGAGGVYSQVVAAVDSWVAMPGTTVH